MRQLQHCIERVVALHPGGPVDFVDTCGNCDQRPERRQPDETAAAALGTALAYQDARAEFEREYLRRLLEAAGGNVSEAARMSGIPRQNLYVRIKRWGTVTE